MPSRCLLPSSSFLLATAATPTMSHLCALVVLATDSILITNTSDTSICVLIKPNDPSVEMQELPRLCYQVWSRGTLLRQTWSQTSLHKAMYGLNHWRLAAKHSQNSIYLSILIKLLSSVNLSSALKHLISLHCNSTDFAGLTGNARAPTRHVLNLVLSTVVTLD